MCAYMLVYIYTPILIIYILIFKNPKITKINSDSD